MPGSHDKLLGFELQSPTGLGGLVDLQDGYGGLVADLGRAGQLGLAANGIEEVLQVRLMDRPVIRRQGQLVAGGGTDSRLSSVAAWARGFFSGSTASPR